MTFLLFPEQHAIIQTVFVVLLTTMLLTTLVVELLVVELLVVWETYPVKAAQRGGFR